MFVLDTARTGAQLYLTAPLSEGVVLDAAPNEVLVPAILQYPSRHLPDAAAALSIEVGSSFYNFLASVPEDFLRQRPRVELNGSILVGEHEVLRDLSDPSRVAVLLKIVTTEQHLDLDVSTCLASAECDARSALTDA